jgi:hypothetical protein
VKFELNHLEWGIVPMPHQVSDQTLIASGRFCSTRVRYSRSLNDSGIKIICGHRVNQANEAIVNLDFIHVSY